MIIVCKSTLVIVVTFKPVGEEYFYNYYSFFSFTKILLSIQLFYFILLFKKKKKLKGNGKFLKYIFLSNGGPLTGIFLFFQSFSLNAQTKC